MKTKIIIICTMVLLLCSCSSSDDTENSKGGQSENTMSLSVSTSSDAETRVTETANSTTGLITTWETTDKLNAFHLYKGDTQVTSKTFINSNLSTSNTAEFECQGSGFTTGKNILMYNILPTSSTFSQTYSNGIITSTLSGFGSQDGTLANLKNYDAMYGVASVTNGVPSNTTMSHLVSVIRFDLKNTAFSGTLLSVKFYCGSASTSLLPSSATISQNESGTITSSSYTGATSWTVSNVAVNSGVASVYLMTFPFSNLSGKLNIVARTTNGDVYYKNITLSSLTLTAGVVSIRPVTLIKLQNITHYYEWDAYEEFGTGTTAFSAGNYGYNNVMAYNATDYLASHSCAKCPTQWQVYAYENAGMYWEDDDNTTLTAFLGIDGTVYHSGLWIKKSSKITGFPDRTNTSFTRSNVAVKSMSSLSGIEASAIRSGGDYFFLPAAGKRKNLNLAEECMGQCYYWLATPSNNTSGNNSQARELFYGGGAGGSVSINSTGRDQAKTKWTDPTLQ